MKSRAPFITEAIGKIPCRLQFAGGWIDQPFVSLLNPTPPGAMVVGKSSLPSVPRIAPASPAARARWP